MLKILKNYRVLKTAKFTCWIRNLPNKIIVLHDDDDRGITPWFELRSKKDDLYDWRFVQTSAASEDYIRKLFKNTKTGVFILDKWSANELWFEPVTVKQPVYVCKTCKKSLSLSQIRYYQKGVRGYDLVIEKELGNLPSLSVINHDFEASDGGDFYCGECNAYLDDLDWNKLTAICDKYIKQWANNVRGKE